MIRNILLGTFLVVTPTVALCQQAPVPDWVPTVIALPETYDVFMNIALPGSSHIFSVHVAEDASPMLPEWQKALESAGYETNDFMLADGRLMFDGNGLSSGQVAAFQDSESGEFVIQIDAEVDAK